MTGIHRNLGTHLSRVRSLELDDWSNELVQTMTSIGNRMINTVYEATHKAQNKVCWRSAIIMGSIYIVIIMGSICINSVFWQNTLIDERRSYWLSFCIKSEYVSIRLFMLKISKSINYGYLVKNFFLI